MHISNAEPASTEVERAFKCQDLLWVAREADNDGNITAIRWHNRGVVNAWWECGGYRVDLHEGVNQEAEVPSGLTMDMPQGTGYSAT